MFKTSQELREEINASQNRIAAIISLAREDNREPTAEEQAEVNAWHGEGDDGGEAAKMEAKLKQAIRIEDRQNQLAAPTLVDALKTGQNGIADLSDGENFAAIKIPARAQAVSALKAYKPDEYKQAYAAGQWFLAAAGNAHAKQWCADHSFSIKAGQIESDPELGGVTVPTPLEAALIRIIVANGKFRQYAAPKTMTSNTLTTPRRVGGVQVYYPGEGDKIEGSQMKFGPVTLTARKYAALAKTSTELSEDSVLNIIDEITTEVGLAMAFAEDQNGFLGDGTAAMGTTTGVHNALGAQSTHQSTQTSVGALTLGDYQKLQELIPDFTGFTPAWFCHKSVFYASMQPLALAAGGTTTQNIVDGVAPMFLGSPVVFVNAMKKAATATTDDSAAFYGDLRQAATIGNRRGMSFKILMEKYADEDMIGIVSTKRTAIEVHETGTAAAAAVAADAAAGLGAIPAVEAAAGPIMKLTLT